MTVAGRLDLGDIGLRNFLNFRTDQIGAQGVALLGAELFFVLPQLEVGRLGGHEKFVHRQLGGFREKPEIGPEFHHGEEVKGFFRGDGPCVAEDPVGAADLIEKHVGPPFEKHLAGVLLVLDDLLDDFEQAVDDFLLRFAEGGLIGDLEKVAEGFGALAVKSAHRQTDFADRIDDLVNLFGEHEGGKVDHGRGAQAGADIGRAGGEVAEIRVKSVGHPVLEK